MSGFYQRVLSKINKLNLDQCRELLVSASREIIRFDTMLDSLPSGILVCDEKHHLITVNKSALHLLPFSPAEVRRAFGSQDTGPLRSVTSSVRKSLPADPLWKLIADERIAGFLQKTLLGNDHIFEYEFDIRAPGYERLLSISVYPLVEKRKITGSLIYVKDIIEKRNKELRLRRTENLASLTTLAAGVAHEIKNPLGAISIHLQLMQKALGKDRAQDRQNTQEDTHLDTQIENYFNILNEDVERLNSIVVNFLFAVRPMPLELRKGNINELIIEFADLLNIELEQSNINLSLELDEKLLPVLFDERYMKQILLNLVKNAQAAMPDGGLLTIATMGSNDKVRINVCDTGIGISQENLKKIFEPFFTTTENGTGLGLTLVYKIIREHQGEMLVDSREGEGTDFEIILPVYQAEKRLIDYSGE
jgi:signal transduction histidine kinase